MKAKIGTYLLPILTMLILGAFQVQHPETLIGAWKLKSLTAEYPKTMSGKSKSAAEADIKDLTGRLKKTTFVFSKDGYLSYLGHKGKWVMSNDGKTVDFIDDAKEKTVASIIKLSADQLIFTRVDDGISQTFCLAKYVKEIH
ncbi:MAG: hypothetical protein JWR09_3437 [Mucilaginibacter sp.]|nr:hypothetical protein [Mucilaginibacter sp.]